MPEAPPQALRRLDLSQNRLTGALPGDLGGVKHLEKLALRGNLLSGSIPAEYSELAPLKLLDLGENRLSGVLPGLSRRLGKLLVDGNRLSGSLPEGLCQLRSLQHLRCSRNALEGIIPECLWKMPQLQQLLLHDNSFKGTLPQFIRAKQLVVLTLHNNALFGSFPNRLSELKSLAVLTLHGNRLSGRIGDLSLTAPCLDNPHFELWGMTCEDWAEEPVDICEGLVSYGFTREEFEELIRNCPRSCNKCDQRQTAKVTLHRNSLSCSIPANVTSGNVLATVVMGNMIGDGHALPAWVSEEEQQEFLYFSQRAYKSNLSIGFGMTVVLLGLVFGRGRVWKALFQASRHAHDCSQIAGVAESGFGVLRFTTLSALLCFAILPIYIWGAGYYSCGQPLCRVTAAYLTGSLGRVACVSAKLLI